MAKDSPRASAEPETSPVALVEVADGVRNTIGMLLQPVSAGVYERRCGRGRLGYLGHFTRDHPNYGTFHDELEPHDVVITAPFLIGRHEVTVGQFRQFVEATGYRTTAEANGAGIVGVLPEREKEKTPFRQRPEFTWRSPGFEQTDDHPVVGVSWDDAKAFCNWLGEQEGTEYRLPTEAEWEYACRAGTVTWFSWGDEYRGRYQRYANLADRTLEAEAPGTASWQWILPKEGDGAAFTSPVGRYEPNPRGLYDVHGNVWEWCEDLFSDTYYKQFSPHGGDPRTAAVDPVNRDQPSYDFGDFRSIRGGSWSVAPIQARTGVRAYFERTDAACYLGFRVVRAAAPDQLAEARRVRTLEEAAEAAFSEFPKTEWTQSNGLALNLHEMPPPDLVAQLPHLGRVRTLSINGEAKVTPGTLAAIAGMPRLQRLNLHNVGEGCPAESFRPLAAAQSLIELHVVISQLSPAVLGDCPWSANLRVLEFGNEKIGDDQLRDFRGIEFEHLESLNLQQTTSDGSSLDVFAEAPLTSLHLRTLSDDGAREVGRFTRLKTLAVGQPRITKEGLEHIVGLERLESLNLQNCVRLGDDDFDGLARMKGLRWLKLNGSGAGDRAARVVANLYLSELTIGSPGLTDAGLESIGRISTLHDRLEIGPTASVTDIGVGRLWGPTSLQTLYLRTPRGITGSGFEAISEMTELRHVEIASEDLEDVGARYLGYLPNLANLVLGHHQHGPRGLTDDGLLLLAEAPNLQRLTLHRTGCPVTDAGLQRLRERRPNLEITLNE